MSQIQKMMASTYNSYKKCTLLLLMLSLINCSVSTQKKKIIYSAMQEKDDFYFPKGTFFYPETMRNKEYDEDQFARDWYSKHLRSMNEPSLSNPTHTFESAYRFLWLRSFNHPLAVRIEKQNNSIHLYSTELSGTGGGEPGRIKKYVKKNISLKVYE